MVDPGEWGLSVLGGQYAFGRTAASFQKGVDQRRKGEIDYESGPAHIEKLLSGRAFVRLLLTWSNELVPNSRSSKNQLGPLGIVLQLSAEARHV